ncbi:MAG: hypothetical protein D6698_08025, partial [Gammaproteobacteria bacterium]
QQVNNQPVGVGLPEQAPLSASTAQMLTPQVGPATQPILDFIIGNAQANAEQAKFNFEKQKYKTSQLEKKGQRQAAINFINNEFAKGTPFAKWVQSRYGDIREGVAAGSVNPYQYRAEYAREQAGIAQENRGRALNQKSVEAAISPLRGTIGWKAFEADKFDWKEMTPTSAEMYLQSIQTMNEAIRKNHYIVKDGDKYYVTNARGKLVEYKGIPPKSAQHRIRTMDQIMAGVEQMHPELNPNIMAAAQQPMTTEDLRNSLRDPQTAEQTNKVIQAAAQKVATDMGIPMERLAQDAPDLMARLNDYLSKSNGAEDITITDAVNQILSEKYQKHVGPSIVGTTERNIVAPGPDQILLTKTYGLSNKKIGKDSLPVRYNTKAGRDAIISYLTETMPYTDALKVWARMQNDVDTRKQVLDAYNARAMQTETTPDTSFLTNQLSNIAEGFKFLTGR